MRSGSRRDRAQPCEPCRGSLSLVVSDKGLDWTEVERGCDMDGVQGPQKRLGERPCTQEHIVIDGSQRDAIEELVRAFPKHLERKLGFHGDRTTQGPGYLRRRQLAAYEIRPGEVCGERGGLSLVTGELDQCARVRVEDGHLSGSRELLRVPGSKHADRHPFSRARAAAPGGAAAKPFLPQSTDRDRTLCSAQGPTRPRVGSDQ